MMIELLTLIFLSPVNEAAQGDVRRWCHTSPPPSLSQTDWQHHWQTHTHTQNTGGGECHSFHTSIIKVTVYLWYHSVSLSMLVRCSCFPVIGNGWYEKVTLCVGVRMCTCTPVFMRPIVSSRPSERGRFSKLRTFRPVLTSSKGY